MSLDSGVSFSVIECRTRRFSSNPNSEGQINTATLLAEFGLPQEIANRVLMVIDGSNCLISLPDDTDCYEGEARGVYEPESGLRFEGVVFVIKGAVRGELQYVFSELQKATIVRKKGPCDTYPTASIPLFREDGPQAIPSAEATDISIINLDRPDQAEPVVRVYAQRENAEIKIVSSQGMIRIPEGQIVEYNARIHEVVFRYTDKGEYIDRDAGINEATDALVGMPEQSGKNSSCEIAVPGNLAVGLVVSFVAAKVLRARK